MQKDFDKWNTEKKDTDSTNNNIIFHEREIWWSKLGVNVGVEIDGRHELFLRPVIIVKKFNKDMAVVIPTTTQDKSNKYYFEIDGVDDKKYKACISHIKTISSKRLLRKIDTIRERDFDLLLDSLCPMIKGDL